PNDFSIPRNERIGELMSFPFELLEINADIRTLGPRLLPGPALFYDFLT
ncbi:MAG: hypothetical protein RLZZ251_622, partial [Actinomycetota bacterium]